MPESPENATRSAARAEVQLPWEVDDGDADAAATPVAEAPPREFHVVDDTEGRGEAVIDYAAAGAGDGYDDFEGEDLDYEHPVPAEPVEDDLGPPPRGGGWTVVALCAGIGLIACCVLIPQADANRRLVYERERLKIDLDSIRKQVATNDEFLHRVDDDPNLAERLAQRQMKIIREGTRVLELKKPPKNGRGAPGPASVLSQTPDDVSPFHLVAVAPPPPMPPYEPTGGPLAGLCFDPHRRLYLMGTGMLLMAVGLVLGFAPKG